MQSECVDISSRRRRGLQVCSVPITAITHLLVLLRTGWQPILMSTQKVLCSFVGSNYHYSMNKKNVLRVESKYKHFYLGCISPVARERLTFNAGGVERLTGY